MFTISNRLLAFVLILAMLGLLSSCPNPGIGTPRSAEISHIGWILENIDRDFWSSSTSSTPTAFINFSGSMVDKKLTAEDFLELRATCSDGTYWSFDSSDISSSGLFNAATGKFADVRCWDSNNPDEIFIGTIIISVTLKNGSTDTFSLIVPEPGSTTTGGNTLGYTEDSDYDSSSVPNTTALLRRAVISTVTNDGTDIVVEWSVDDNRVNTGNVWFYTSSMDVVGSADNLLIDPVSRDIAISCNGGGEFYTDDTTNTIRLNSSSINFQSGYSIGDIERVVIPLWDGNQYPAETWYDCRSYSGSFPVTDI